ncbi:MAG: DUF5123 domain-containing protein [bacterium]|nr:DUF5123 domain-containing protein [bacterium]
MKRILHVLIVCSTIGFLFSNSVSAQPAVGDRLFFVSPAGDDGGDGSIQAPFATLSRARDAVREWKQSNGLKQPVTVFLREGTYFLTEPLTFGPQDSGVEAAPVTYSAYRDETAVISGGVRLPKLSESSGAGVAAIPESINGGRAFYQLFVNGERRTRARTPDEGYYHFDGSLTLADPAYFPYKEGDILPAWAERGDVEINALSKWAGFRMPITAIDAEKHLATVSKAVSQSSWSGKKDNRYWIENAPECLDAPGEWFFDSKTRELKYLPESGETVGELELIAPAIERLIVIEGDPQNGAFVEHLQFKNLTFSHTRAYQLDEGYPELQAAYQVPAAFSAIGASYCLVDGCRFVNLGNYAVEFSRGCKNNTISYNLMAGLGAGGVKIGETANREDEASRTEYNVVSDNDIHDIGVLYPAAVGVWIGLSAHNQAIHNLVYDTYYTAFSVGWSWGYNPTNCHDNLIAYNHAYNIGRGVLSDMGGVYTLGYQPGTVVRNNHFHHVVSYDYGGWGLYTDEGSTGTVWENNVIHHCKTAGFHQHYGKENIIRNNIFALNTEQQLQRTRNEEHLSFYFENNIVYWKQGVLLGSNWKENKYKFDNNVYWNPDQSDFKFSQWTWDEWRAKGQDEHSVIADPLFADPENGDFTLAPESPALKLGFKPIDMSEIGPRKR